MRARARSAGALLVAVALLAAPAAARAEAPATPPSRRRAAARDRRRSPRPRRRRCCPAACGSGSATRRPTCSRDPRFVALGVRYARLAIGWDAMTSHWQIEQLDAWLAAARPLNIQPLISLGHSRTDRRSLPTPERLKFEFRTLRERYPWVKTFAVWNEANHCGEPVCHRAPLVASYYRAMRRECPQCTILGPEILDMPNAVAYIKAFRKKLGFTPEALGPAQLPRGQPLQDGPAAADHQGDGAAPTSG